MYITITLRAWIARSLSISIARGSLDYLAKMSVMHWNLHPVWHACQSLPLPKCTAASVAGGVCNITVTRIYTEKKLFLLLSIKFCSGYDE